RVPQLTHRVLVSDPLVADAHDDEVGFLRFVDELLVDILLDRARHGPDTRALVGLGGALPELVGALLVGRSHEGDAGAAGLRQTKSEIEGHVLVEPAAVGHGDLAPSLEAQALVGRVYEHGHVGATAPQHVAYS